MVKNNDVFQRYLDAGIAFTHMTRRRAEALVQELVQSGDLQGGDARAKVDELIERSRKGSEALMGQIRTEVAQQLHSVGITSLEDLATQVAALLGRSAEAGRHAASKRGPAKKTAAKKAAPAKKTAAKKAAPAKKTAAKKAAGKEDRRQEGCTGKEDRRHEEGCRQEGAGQEGSGDQGHAPPDGIGGLTPPSRPARQRLDRALVARGLVESRPQAVALIGRGAVLVSGAIAETPARLVSPAEPIELRGDPQRFVGRGGEKLSAALDPVRARPDRSACARCRRLDRGIHRLPAPGRRHRGGCGRRGARPAPPETAGRPEGRRTRTSRRPCAHPRDRSGDGRQTWSPPTSRSSR